MTESRQRSWVSGFLRGGYRELCDLAVLLLIAAYIVWAMGPRNLVSPTTTTGGDTGSHVYGAWYLTQVLLPQGRVTGWCPGNYAGFPLFQFYFPLPFLLTSALSTVMSFNVAFKVASVLCILLVPVASYAALRTLRVRFPGPALGAIFSMPFLFGEGHSMWGGNILSCLAGEIGYEYGFALSILFLAGMRSGLRRGRRVVLNAAILALTGLSHGVGLVVAVTGCLFFLLRPRDFWCRLLYVLRVMGLAVGLMAFWLLPFMAGSAWTTGSNDIWSVDTIQQILPTVAWPYAAAGVIAAVAMFLWTGRRWLRLCGHVFVFYAFLLLLAGVLFETAYELNVINIRFLPYVSYLLLQCAAVAFAAAVRRLQGKPLLAAIALAATVFWVESRTESVAGWSSWNYSGFETKPGWRQLQGISNHLRANAKDSRVVYEHADIYERFGTTRAFENLPLFADCPTIEGLYIQSTISAPFAFYLQSEISRASSTPLSQFDYTWPDLDRAVHHFRMLNISHYIVATPQIKALAAANAGLELDRSFGDIDLYRVKGGAGGYVEPLMYAPRVSSRENWRMKAHRWFQNPGPDHPFVLFVKRGAMSRPELAGLRNVGADENFMKLSGERLPGTPPRVSSEVGNERIVIRDAQPGWPLLIKMSYHPNWKCKGASGPYLATPSHMVVFPAASEVEMTFGRSSAEILGWLVSALTLVICCVPLPFSGWLLRAPWWGRAGAEPSQVLRAGLITVWVVATLGVTVRVVDNRITEPERLLEKVKQHVDANRYDRAEVLCGKLLIRYAGTATEDDARIFAAKIKLRTDQFDLAIDAFREFETQHPFSIHLPECMYHRAEASFRLGRAATAVSTWESLRKKFPTSAWARYADERLQEIAKP